MATNDQLAAALKAADAAGDTEGAAKLAGALRAQMAAPEPTQPAEAPTVAPNTERGGILRGVITPGGQVDATLMGWRAPVDAAAQMLPRGLSSAAEFIGGGPNVVSRYLDDQAKGLVQQAGENEADYQQQRLVQGRTGFDATRLAGNILSPANLAPASRLAGLGTRAAQLAPKVATAVKLATAVPTGAALGTLQPVTDPNADFAAEKLKQAEVGAVAGPLGQIAGGVASRVINPVRDAATQLLIKEGVKMTPGQLLGGVAKKLEDAATSIPFLGSSIESARKVASDTFSKAAANRALAPIGGKVPESVEAGHDTTQYVRTQLGNAYDALLPKLTLKPDQQLMTDFQGLAQKAGSLTEEHAKQFQTIIRDNIARRLTNGQGALTGDAFKAAESELKNKAKSFLGSSSANERELGSLLQDTLVSLRSGLARSNPNEAPALQAINQGYANFARLRQAGSSVAAEDGVFSPAQLLNAVKAGDKSAGKGQFATGNALMQDLAAAGKKVIPSKTGDSGTAPRIIAAKSLGGLLTGAGVAMNPNLLAGIGAGMAAYSQPGQYVLRAALTGAPQARNQLAQLAAQYGQVALPGITPLVQVGQ